MAVIGLCAAVAILLAAAPTKGQLANTVPATRGLESCSASRASCLQVNEDIAVFPASGSAGEAPFYIGGIFPVHERGAEAFGCGTINTDSFQEAMAFQWAVSTASQRLGNAVPSAPKGAVLFDSCGAENKATQSVYGIEKCKTKVALGGDNNVTAPMNLVDRTNILGFVSGVDSRNGQSQEEASRMVIGLQKPVISTGTFSDRLTVGQPGARNNFLAPTIRQQMEATANLVKKSVALGGDVYVMVLHSSTRFSSEAFSEFKMAAAAKNICVVYESRLDSPLQNTQVDTTARNLLINRDARFVVSLLPTEAFRTIQRRLLERTDNIYNFTFVFPPFAEDSGNVLLETSVVALGALQVRHDYRAVGLNDLETFKTYYRELTPANFPDVPLVFEFWQQRFQCNLLDQTGVGALRYRDFCTDSSLTLKDDPINPRVGYVIAAVDALLVSIEEVRRRICPTQGFCLARSLAEFDQEIAGVTVRNQTIFDADTGGPAYWGFEVFNLVGGNNDAIYEKVGTFEKSVLNFQEKKKVVAYQRVKQENNEQRLERVPVESSCPPGKCFVCRAPVTGVVPKPAAPPETDTNNMDRLLPKGLATHRMSRDAYITGIHFTQDRHTSNFTTRLVFSKYRSVWGVALAVLAGLGIIAVLVVEGYLIYLLKTYKFVGPDGDKVSHFNYRTLWLGQVLLFGIFLSYLTLFAYLPVPTKATCGITRFGIGISYAIMFSCLLVKVMVLLSTRVTEKFVPGLIHTPFYQRVGPMVALFLAAFSVQLIIDIQWLIQVPPAAVLVEDNAGQLAWICNHYTWSVKYGFYDMSHFFRSEFDNHLLSLIYIMFLILVTFLFSLKSFDIVTNMRESRFITLAVGISILIFIPWAMIGGFLRDHAAAHEIGDGCIGFGLFFIATVILFAMFLPKVRQLATIGLEGVFLEDDKETTYASSVYSPPSMIAPGHHSMSTYADGSVIGMQTLDRSLHLAPEDLGPRPIITVDTSFVSNDPNIHDPHALRLLHPRSQGPSLYSVRSTPNLYDPPDPYSTGTRGMKVTRDLTGRSYINESFTGSEYPSLYRPKSETHLYRHPHSDIGSL